MMWKIQQAVKDDVIRATLFPCCFLPANRVKCSYGKICLLGSACFHRRIANHEKMAAALKRLRDSLELQQFIQDAEDVCCLNCLLFVINFS